jgi:hypothetical protein
LANFRVERIVRFKFAADALLGRPAAGGLRRRLQSWATAPFAQNGTVSKLNWAHLELCASF